jgi:hypothetical protein
MKLNGNQLEELGFKAQKKGFFVQWQALTIKLSQEKKMTLNEAAEFAFRELHQNYLITKYGKLRKN